MKTPMHSTAYRPHIDGIRAIAVLAVVVYHLDPPILPGGFAGVDIFFVISGFVVAMASSARALPPVGTFLADFLARRIRRIFPALVVCLFVTSLASALWIPASWLSDSIPRTGWLAFFGLSNVALAGSANDYFSPRAGFNPFTHTWSLAVEEQFYVVVPILLWSWIRGGRWRAGAMVALVASATTSLAYAWVVVDDGGAGYFLLSTRLWELSSGVVLYWTLSHLDSSCAGHRLSHAIEAYVAPVALLALAFALVTSRPEDFPGRGAWLPVASTMLLLGSLHRARGKALVQRLLACAPLRHIGELSYSLYLWHWPVIVLFRWTVGLGDPLRIASAVALSFVLAWLSRRMVEKPFLHAGARFTPRRVIVTGFLVALVAAQSAHVLQKRQHLISPSHVAKERDDWYPSRAQKLTSPEGCSVAPRRTDLARGWFHTYERKGCKTGGPAPRVFALGDSHTLAYGPLFARYAMETGVMVTVYNNGGCPLMSLQPAREASGHCEEATHLALANLLPRLRASDVVFLPSLRLPRYVEQGWVVPDAVVASRVWGPEASEAREASMGSARDVLKTLRSTGVRVVIQAPNVVLKAPAFRCADWWTKSNPICAAGVAIDRSEFLGLRAPVLNALTSLADADEGVSLFDPMPSLCPEGITCSGFRDGRPLFFDGDHLSAYGNQVVYPAFLATMQSTACPATECFR